MEPTEIIIEYGRPGDPHWYVMRCPTQRTFAGNILARCETKENAERVAACLRLGEGWATEAIDGGRVVARCVAEVDAK